MRQGAVERRAVAGNKRVVVAFVVACFVVLLFGAQIQPVAGMVSPVYVPIVSVVSSAAAAISSTVSSITKLPQLEQQNNALRRQVAMLKHEAAMVHIYQREDARFSKALNFHDLNPHLDLASAAVIGRGATGLSDTLTVGAGSNEGVRMNNPVVDKNGFVVGKVTSVLPAQSTVSLVTANNVNILAMDARTGAAGLVETPMGKTPVFGDIAIGRRVRAGDFIVASGMGNEFPIGTLIGQVIKVEGGSAASFHTAPINTEADLNSLDYVQILTNFGPGIHVDYSLSPSRRIPVH